jgi:uncharacterized protein (TIGR02266 family)
MAKKAKKDKNWADKRSHPRKDVKIYGVFRKDIELSETEVMMENLSMGGAFIISDDPPPKGSPVMLQFMIPGDESPISVIGNVTWTKTSAEKDEKKGMGVKFTIANKFDLERLKKYLQKILEDEELF